MFGCSRALLAKGPWRFFGFAVGSVGKGWGVRGLNSRACGPNSALDAKLAVVGPLELSGLGTLGAESLRAFRPPSGLTEGKG